MKTVVIDNFDSFTYNLVHYIEEILRERPVVLRNNAFQMDELDQFDCIVLSPGPGLPADAGLMMSVLEHYSKSKIILGVCLGHQAIGEYFGTQLTNLTKVFHGVDSRIKVTGDAILYKNDTTVQVGRYHSWAISDNNFPSELEVTSVDDSNIIMSVKHKSLPIHGIQYHPESVLTPDGKELLRNFFDHYSTWRS
jgi:anthranilate synthase component 2